MMTLKKVFEVLTVIRLRICGGTATQTITTMSLGSIKLLWTLYNLGIRLLVKSTDRPSVPTRYPHN